jgi:hypothetical protein
VFVADQEICTEIKKNLQITGINLYLTLATRHEVKRLKRSLNHALKRLPRSSSVKHVGTTCIEKLFKHDKPGMYDVTLSAIQVFAP